MYLDIHAYCIAKHSGKNLQGIHRSINPTVLKHTHRKKIPYAYDWASTAHKQGFAPDAPTHSFTPSHTHAVYNTQVGIYCVHMLRDLHWSKYMLKEELTLTDHWQVYHPQGTDFHPKYTGENLTCTVQGLKRSTQYKFRVSDDVTWTRVCFCLCT